MICKWKEDKADGRGIYTGADGTCLVVPLRPNSLVGNPPHKCHTQCTPVAKLSHLPHLLCCPRPRSALHDTPGLPGPWAARAPQAGAKLGVPRLYAGPDSVTIHSALQGAGTKVTSRRADSTVEVFSYRPMVCAMWSSWD